MSGKNEQELVINFQIPLTNVYIAKQLVDGLIWKALSMRTWLQDRVNTDTEKLDKLIGDGENPGAEDPQVERIASIIGMNENSISELGRVIHDLTSYYEGQWKEKPPSTLPREQRTGGSNAKAIIERIRAAKAKA